MTQQQKLATLGPLAFHPEPGILAIPLQVAGGGVERYLVGREDAERLRDYLVRVLTPNSEAPEWNKPKELKRLKFKPLGDPDFFVAGEPDYWPTWLGHAQPVNDTTWGCWFDPEAERPENLSDAIAEVIYGKRGNQASTLPGVSRQ